MYFVAKIVPYLGAPSIWLLCPFDMASIILGALPYFLAPQDIPYSSCPSFGINYFSKEPWFFYLETKIWGLGVNIAIKVLLLLGHFSGQR